VESFKSRPGERHLKGYSIGPVTDKSIAKSKRSSVRSAAKRHTEMPTVLPTEIDQQRKQPRLADM
jgi:hypothetical protein